MSATLLRTLSWRLGGMSGVGCGLAAPPVGSRRGDRRECGSFLARPRTPQPAPLRTGESAATKVAAKSPYKLQWMAWIL